MGHFEELPGVWPTADYAPTAAQYLANNPDVAKDAYFSARPLEHWERYGKNEGRSWTAPAESGGGEGGGGGGGESSLSMPAFSAPRGESRPAPVAPTMPQLPKLDLSQGSSVNYQLNKLQSLDSLPMQQAKVNAFENGVASGAIHGSQQAGAAQRAVTEAVKPIATAEANRIGGQDIQNWSTEVKRLNDIYEKEYAGYLAKLGYESNQKIAMTQANTSLSTSLLSSMTSLMNNPDIVFGEEVKNKLTSVYNSAMMNNNTILDMGFTYA